LDGWSTWRLNGWTAWRLNTWILFFIFYGQFKDWICFYFFILIHGQLGEFGYLSLIMTIRAIPNAEVHHHSSQEDLKKDFEDKYPCNILLKYIIFFLP